MGLFQACCSAETQATNVPLQQPEPQPPAPAAAASVNSAVERGVALTAELQMLTKAQLKARATVAGVPAVAIQRAESTSDPQSALIALLVAQDAVASSVPTADGVAGSIFDSLDSNGDGAWDADELPATPVTAACFSFLDKDGDGKVTKAEVIAGVTALAGMAAMYMSKNGVPPQLHALLSMVPGAASVLPAPAKS
jgi:hypothetical protein